MAQFVDPKTVLPMENMDARALTRAIRQAIAAEEEAVALYETIADSTNDELAKEVLQDIANEEKVHVGELVRLLTTLTNGSEADFFAKGIDEVVEVERKVASIANRVARNVHRSASFIHSLDRVSEMMGSKALYLYFRRSDSNEANTPVSVRFDNGDELMLSCSGVLTGYATVMLQRAHQADADDPTRIMTEYDAHCVYPNTPKAVVSFLMNSALSIIDEHVAVTPLYESDPSVRLASIIEALEKWMPLFIKENRK